MCNFLADSKLLFEMRATLHILITLIVEVKGWENLRERGCISCDYYLFLFFFSPFLYSLILSRPSSLSLISFLLFPFPILFLKWCICRDLQIREDSGCCIWNWLSRARYNWKWRDWKRDRKENKELKIMSVFDHGSYDKALERKPMLYCTSNPRGYFFYTLFWRFSFLVYTMC